ncbi:MAG: hypothetical protein R3Y21_04165 [Mycoplasmatota bacterium]
MYLDLREFTEVENVKTIETSYTFNFSLDGWMIREFGKNIPNKMFYYCENENTTMYVNQVDGVYYCYLYDGETVYTTTANVIDFDMDNLYFEKLTSGMQNAIKMELQMLELFLKTFYVKRCFNSTQTTDEISIESSNAKSFSIIENTKKNIVAEISDYSLIGKWVITNCNFAYDIEE